MFSVGTYSDFPFSDQGSASVEVSVTGVSGVTTLGNETVFLDMKFDVNGVVGTTTLGTVAVFEGAVANITAPAALQAGLGSVFIFTGIIVNVNNTNLLMTAELGNENVVIPSIIDVTPLPALQAQLGQETVIAGSVIAKPRQDETFDVTVANNGSGNVYYLNNFMQTTIDSLHPPFTYRFDQSDSSNNNHPLRFSTTPDGSHANDETFTITVQNVNGANKYFVNGVQQQMPFALKKGSTYKFDQSNTSNNNHPLRFSTTDNGSWAGGSEYTNGVTVVGVPGQAGAYTQIVVANNAPAQLYTYCLNHSGMGFGVSITAGVEYTTGVVVNGVPGNAGAYVEITLADNTPQLYVYCTNHSGMGFKLIQSYNAEIIGTTELNSVIIQSSVFIQITSANLGLFATLADTSTIVVSGSAFISVTGVSATGFISSSDPAVNVWAVINDSQTPGWTEIAA